MLIREGLMVLIVSAAVVCVSPQALVSQGAAPTRALASTVDAIVQEGGYAGLIVKLDPVVGLETSYPVAALLVHPRWRVPVPPVGTSLRRLLKVHESADRRLDDMRPRLVDRRATRCLSALQKSIQRLYVGSTAHVTTALTADAAGRTPVLGTVGSGVCTTDARLHTGTVVATGPTYADALDQVVAQSGGSVWIAAENGRGQCGVGLVSRGQPLRPDVPCFGTHLLEIPPFVPQGTGAGPRG